MKMQFLSCKIRAVCQFESVGCFMVVSEASYIVCTAKLIQHLDYSGCFDACAATF